MTDTWLDTATVAQLLRCTRREVQLRADSREYRSRMYRHGRRGRPQLQVALSSLSADAQMRFARLQLEAAECHALVPADPAQPTLFASPAQIDLRAWADVPDDRKQEAAARLKMITPMIEWSVGNRQQFALGDGSTVRTIEDLARYLAEQNNLSRATIFNYYTAFKKEGVTGLVRDRRSDSNKSKYFESHPDAAKFVLAKYQELGQCSPTGSPNLALIYDELVREYKRLYPGERRAPAYCTVRNYLAALPPVIRDAARLTREKHDARYAPTLRTNIPATRVNQYWVADHRVFDILGYNDCFPEVDRYSLFRVWMTAIEDMRSRVLWGVFCASPSWKTIASALRVGMMRFGQPEVFYCDNGKDFKKVGGAYARTPQNMDDAGIIRAGLLTENLLQRLKIVPQYCLPKHPRSKMIESAFSYVSQRCDVMFGAGYAGAKPSLRPDRCREAEKQHHAWLQQKADKTPFLPVSHIIDLLSCWFEERNKFHSHSGDGMDGRTAYEVMAELLPEPKPVDVTAIEPLFWEHRRCIVRRTAVQVDNEIYEGVDEAAVYAMYAVNGQEITVAYDPYDRRRALAVVDRRVIAQLHPKPRVDRGLPGERSAATDAAIASVAHIGRGAYNEIQRRWEGTTSGVPSMLDGLRERHQLAAPADVTPPPIASRAAAAPSIEPAWPEDEAEKFLQRHREGN
jgi:putative transposase